MAPVIFLDLDGVLIAPDGSWSAIAMNELNRLCRDTGAGIVFSTSSRTTRTVAELHQMMLDCGFEETHPVLGETRDLSALRDAARQGRWLYGFRLQSKGEEIEQWLTAHPEAQHFVIIDDQPQQWPPFEEFTVVPKGVFSCENRLQAMTILQRVFVRDSMPHLEGRADPG